jgi:phage baseplate assembly protein W
MAIEINKPALDFETDVAIGLAIPIGSYAGSTFTSTYTSLDAAVANAKNLLLTNHGERPMRPTFGCNLRGVLFDNATDDFVEVMEEQIRESFKHQLPYINISKLIIGSSDTNPNQVGIQLSINLIGNEFDTRQIDVTVNADNPEQTTY